jgi:hypothetical protein
MQINYIASKRCPRCLVSCKSRFLPKIDSLEYLGIFGFQFLRILSISTVGSRVYGNILFLCVLLTLSFKFIPFLPFIFRLTSAHIWDVGTLKSNKPGAGVLQSPTVACLYLSLGQHYSDHTVRRAGILVDLFYLMMDGWMGLTLSNSSLDGFLVNCCTFKLANVFISRNHLISSFLEFSRRHFLIPLKI